MEILSPCIKVCTLDNTKKVCKGCNRTIQEIKEWQHMSEREKIEVIKRISLIGDKRV